MIGGAIDVRQGVLNRRISNLREEDATFGSSYTVQGVQ